MSNSINISSDDVKDLPKMGLDDTGTMTIKFRVKGANLYDKLEEGGPIDSPEISYNMEYEILEINVDKVSLSEATRRAVEKQEPILVKNNINPFPG